MCSKQKLPKATHSGNIYIGNKTIACAVLEDGTRVITQSTMLKALGKSKGGTQKYSGGGPLPSFLDYKGLKPFISNELEVCARPLIFKTPKGANAYGFRATLLPDICDVYLSARKAKTLPHNQQHIAEECEIIVRALSKIGIISLVDEATGYQYERERDALQIILSKFISKEFLPWVKRFPIQFFKLYKRMYDVETEKGCPPHVGHFINSFIYKKLAPGVLEELRIKNPITEKGYRKQAHHQWLTNDTGCDSLNRQILQVITLMKVSENREDFERLYNKAGEITKEWV